jgi:hypothetical protein
MHVGTPSQGKIQRFSTNHAAIMPTKRKTVCVSIVLLLLRFWPARGAIPKWFDGMDRTGQDVAT